MKNILSPDGSEAHGTPLIKVRFEPDCIEIHVPVTTTISAAAHAAGCAVELSCGGMGTCGKCRVIASGELSPADSTELRLISEEDRASGVRLACRTKVLGDAAVTIPGSSRSILQKILSSGSLREVHLDPGVTKIHVKLTPPSLEDERAEFERLADALMPEDINLRVSLDLVQDISAAMRAAEYDLTAVISGDQLIAIEPGDTTAANYGIAFDLGSTTVVGYLMDLATGRELAVASAMNAQMAYGDDLISRIRFAMTEENGRELLRRTVLDVLNHIVREACVKAGVSPADIYDATLVGNTCMTHLLLGIDPTSLGLSPYVPAICAQVSEPASKVGLEICPRGRVHVLPNVAGFVGSDLVAVVLSSMWEDDGRTRLAVDIGTNGEMALRHNGKTYACSAAAGPAFEGARISCGMRGAPGAIDSVNIGET